MMRPIRRNAVRPGDVNRIFLAGRYPASRLSLRGTNVWVFPANRLFEWPETEATIFILSSGRYVSTVHCGNRHDFSVKWNQSPVIPVWHASGAEFPTVLTPSSCESLVSILRRQSVCLNSAFVTPDGLVGGGKLGCRLRHNSARNMKKYNKTEKLSKGFTQNLEKIRIKSQ